MKDEELLLAEYKHFSDSFWKNEEIGERRVNYFITLVTAIIAAIVALLTSEKTGYADIDMRRVATFALTGTLLFGLVTYLRMLRRNQVTDEYVEVINYLRERMRRRSSSLLEYELPLRTRKSRLFGGGLAETVAVINSFILTVVCMLWLWASWGWLIAPVIFFGSVIPQVTFARKKRQEKANHTQTFRAGVGAFIVNQQGNVLALERRDAPGAWQLPQGGLERGEELLEAVQREVREETGISANNLRLLTPEPLLLAYELPKEYRSKKTGRGQVHYWFRFRYEGSNESITLGDKKEFKDWKWMAMDELISQIVPFRRAVYDELAKDISARSEDVS